MKNLISLLLSLLLLVLIPTGFASIHNYIQTKDKVSHLAASLTAYLSKRGTLKPSTSSTLVQDFVTNEINENALELDPNQLHVVVTREVDAFSDEELTAYDKFQVAVEYPRPWMVAWLAEAAPNYQVKWTGTMEPVPHYKE
ncbi:hypothetical protein [Brevibacillus centrosporus]|uniref:hypothetical protein n=1 Tax=Brevibacillus centrosporus TaxID=54910 RepID=UPI003B01882A